MKLFDLSAETLSAIIIHLHGFDIANLWFSGSSPLHYKLANGGISQLDWNFNAERRPFKWPSLFFALQQLSCFRISVASDNPSVLFTSSQLAMLPRNLKEMRLNCLGAIHALNDLLALNPDFFPALKTLEIEIRVKDTPFGPKQAMKWPQNLTSLQVNPAANREFPLDLSTLPPNLTTLYGTFSEIVIPTATYRFPQSLAKLNLALCRFFDILPLLPACLEELHWVFIHSVSFYEDGNLYKAWTEHGICNLPPNLQSISLPIDAYTCDILRQLPPTITEIQYYQANSLSTEEELNLLPPRLSNCSYLLPRLVTKAIAQYLPKSIVAFEPGWVTLDAIPFLNPKTSRLLLSDELLSTPSFASLGIDRIPLELKTLSLPEPNYVPFSALPQSLTSLSFQRGALTTSQVESLPRSLLSLYLDDSEETNSIEDWKSLPENLQELTCCSALHLPTESSLLFPRKLTMLTLFGCQSVTQDWFKGLPQTLKTLRLSLVAFAEPFVGNIVWPTDMTDLQLNVENYELKTQTMSNLLKTLPKLITNLSVRWSPLHSKFSVSEEDMASLPKRLDLSKLRLPVGKSRTRF